MISFSDEYFVFDDVYALPIEVAEKLLVQLEAALREASSRLRQLVLRT